MLLSDMELLYSVISSLKSNAKFTSFHLFLLLNSKKCSKELKSKFALLPISQVQLPAIPIAQVYELGIDFVEPIMSALEQTLDDSGKKSFLQFRSFLDYKFCFLFDRK